MAIFADSAVLKITSGESSSWANQGWPGCVERNAETQAILENVLQLAPVDSKTKEQIISKELVADFYDQCFRASPQSIYRARGKDRPIEDDPSIVNALLMRRYATQTIAAGDYDPRSAVAYIAVSAATVAEAQGIPLAPDNDFDKLSISFPRGLDLIVPHFGIKDYNVGASILELVTTERRVIPHGQDRDIKRVYAKHAVCGWDEAAATIGSVLARATDAPAGTLFQPNRPKVEIKIGKQAPVVKTY